MSTSNDRMSVVLAGACRTTRISSGKRFQLSLKDGHALMVLMFSITSSETCNRRLDSFLGDCMLPRSVSHRYLTSARDSSVLVCCLSIIHFEHLIISLVPVNISCPPCIVHQLNHRKLG